MTTSNQITLPQTLALLYLSTPVLIFFAWFVRWEIALPSCTLCVYFIVGILKNTEYSFNTDIFLRILFAGFYSTILSALAGGSNLFFINGDWEKHFAILNTLFDNTWPVRELTENGIIETLRYSIGWYLVPAGLLKIFSQLSPSIAIYSWMWLGLTLFFWSLYDLLPGKLGLYFLPLLFSVFGGMDIVGTWLTGFTSSTAYHIEWWAGWIQYASNIAALFWTPQHALPAWLGIVLLMSQTEKNNLINYVCFIFFCIMLASPFAAIGLIPFGFSLFFYHDRFKLLFNWRHWISLLIIGIPLAIYLTADTEQIISGFIWNIPCVADAEHCFSWASYFLFLSIELAPFIIFLFVGKRFNSYFLIAATIFLFILPIYRLGIYNDLAMRSSLPALAFIAISVGKAIIERQSPIWLPLLTALLIGSLTGGGELRRAISYSPTISDQTRFINLKMGGYLNQYFTGNDIIILRK